MIDLQIRLGYGLLILLQLTIQCLGMEGQKHISGLYLIPHLDLEGVHDQLVLIHQLIILIDCISISVLFKIHQREFCLEFRCKISPDHIRGFQSCCIADGHLR